MSHNVYQRFGFRLDDLPTVVKTFDFPEKISTRSRHAFSGEEAVLLLLRRFRSTCPLLELTKETGRSVAALSEIIQWSVEYIRDRYAHLVDDRSFLDWTDKFSTFAKAFRDAGLPVDDLVAFIDGHKRVHGIKTQGLIFPNGVQPYPYGPINGARHDSFVLRQSGILEMMDEVRTITGCDFVLFGDSAYPQHRHLWAMYKDSGSGLQGWQLAFNSDMSPERVTVEWGFGQIVRLWPFVDCRSKMEVLHSPIGMYLEIANILTNVHTCLYGNAVSRKYGLGHVSLKAYMTGNGKHL